MMDTLKEKMNSWAMWLAIAALIVFPVKTFAGMDISGTTDDLLNVLLPVFVDFGIVNTPNSRENL